MKEGRKGERDVFWAEKVDEGMQNRERFEEGFREGEGKANLMIFWRAWVDDFAEREERVLMIRAKL